jgi:hypothetical protein
VANRTKRGRKERVEMENGDTGIDRLHQGKTQTKQTSKNGGLEQGNRCHNAYPCNIGIFYFIYKLDYEMW